ncbi:MAG: 16S rRNA processing protein RimM [Candidatus Melainabacteria bacterium]|nr:MAG: 16S rRNA processing protein RimM [Candidatus Melainabacteria bacterium]
MPKNKAHLGKNSEIDASLPGADSLFPVGKVVGMHGLRGIMKIKPSSNNPQLLLDIETVQVVLPNGTIEEANVDTIYLEKRMLFLKLKECVDRTAAEKYLDASISTTRAQLRNLEENEWWVDDLIGLPVFTTDGVEIGTVSDIIGANSELLEIKKKDNDEAEPILVPFVEALVPVVDIIARRVEVVALPGLLD